MRVHSYLGEKHCIAFSLNLHSIAKYCTATWGDDHTTLQFLHSILHTSIIQVRTVLYIHSTTLLLVEGGRIARGMLEGIVPRYQLYSNPPCLSLSSKYPIFAAICSHLRFIYRFFHFSVKKSFPSFFSHFVQLSIVMQALLSPPQPPFPDLPEFLWGIITFFQDFFQQFSEEKSRSFRISFNNSLRNNHVLSGFLSAILWGIITLFQNFFQQFSEE